MVNAAAGHYPDVSFPLKNLTNADYTINEGQELGQILIFREAAVAGRMDVRKTGGDRQAEGMFLLIRPPTDALQKELAKRQSNCPEDEAVQPAPERAEECDEVNESE